MGQPARRATRWSRPRYQDIRGSASTLLTSADGGALVRVIAGDVAGHAGPGATHTPISVVHATLSPGAAAVALPWRADFNALVYVLAGRGSVGAERPPDQAGQLAVLGAGDSITVAAPTTGQDSPSPPSTCYSSAAAHPASPSRTTARS